MGDVELEALARDLHDASVVQTPCAAAADAVDRAASSLPDENAQVFLRIARTLRRWGT
jgi:hypothetical protein